MKICHINQISGIVLFDLRYDTTMNRVIEGNLEDHGQIHHPAGLSYTQSIPDRWVHIHLIHPKQFLGFNIRGGREYGLGVYVSR